MELNLEGQVGFVSGSSSGIGKCVAETLAREGCVVYVNGRNPDSLREAVDDIRGKTGNPQVRGICCDISQSAAIQDALSQIVTERGSPPSLTVANLGSGRSHLGWDVSDEEWERVFTVNLFSAIRLVREVVRATRSTGGGSIVCVSSIAGCAAMAAPIPYSTAKAALLSFVKTTADVVAADGVRINAVSPGNVDFPGSVWDLKKRSDPEQVRDYIRHNVPMNDFASVQDIADMIAFALSPRCRFVTGANFVVDGGQNRRLI